MEAYLQKVLERSYEPIQMRIKLHNFVIFIIFVKHILIFMISVKRTLNRMTSLEVTQSR